MSEMGVAMVVVPSRLGKCAGRYFRVCALDRCGTLPTSDGVVRTLHVFTVMGMNVCDALPAPAGEGPSARIVGTGTTVPLSPTTGG